MNHGRLHGKRCLITGAARGIGATAARLFAREGASVVLFDLKDELGAEVVADIVRAGGEASYLPARPSKETSRTFPKRIGIALDYRWRLHREITARHERPNQAKHR